MQYVIFYTKSVPQTQNIVNGEFYMAKGLYKKWLEPENLTLLKGWRRDGLEMSQIADNIGIRRQTLYDWCTKYKEIADALKKGDEICIYEVENALYRSAVGYDVTETDQTETEGPNGITRTKHARKRHIPPNLGAICFILKNRRPEKWRDRPLVEDNRALDMLANILAETKKAAEEDDSTEIQSEAEGVYPELE